MLKILYVMGKTVLSRIWACFTWKNKQHTVHLLTGIFEDSEAGFLLLEAFKKYFLQDWSLVFEKCLSAYSFTAWK